MSNAFNLAAEPRETFGKGTARKLRVAGKTPVVVYGHGEAPRHYSVETHPLSLIVRHPNALVSLEIDGSKELVLVKDVQKNAVRQTIEHVDLLIVRRGETVEVEVPVAIEGDPFPGTTVLHELATVLVSAPATDIPEHFVVNVDGKTDGSQITAGDLELPNGVELVTGADELLVNVVIAQKADDDDFEAAEEAAAAEAE
ncbi:50S ribosomal protein L25/general stress protein Ctc [Leucobacter sp. OH1287]|uniref:50S ribosomal protein L25/general stress protein Ctc n=1 Tax=Leucobacter sp. OH1287 TaxID=2491049 RepID=UPI000F5EE4DF|nr:50S ribosomal protein L25/general stress protein Ctc [Leucobacter sp. OH1287]RRD60515.1 50S ribosomal protein L25/general stress protein Ctc [Leucobacter sp. OH1287]